MEPRFREAYNKAYTSEHHRRYVSGVESIVGCTIPFRVAETPFFIPKPLRQRLETYARDIVRIVSDPARIAAATSAVPAHLNVPGLDALPNCVQVDFAICRDAQGNLDAKLVEFQGFPSLYMLTVLQAESMANVLKTMPGLDRPWTVLFNNLTHDDIVRKMRHALVGDLPAEEVLLLDIDPPSQKTFPDFEATRLLTGVEWACPTSLLREGKQLFRMKDGKKIRVRKIFNRIVFDEYLSKKPAFPWTYTEELDVAWFPHPNWYWIWSKYTIPSIEHSSVPRARFVSDLSHSDLASLDYKNSVLKPLFSFAGTGVKVDFDRADIDAIPESDRHGWIVQEKIEYAPAIVSPEGHGIKAEVRMMFLRAPDQAEPELVMNLTRLSRGKMLGVDQNRNFDWVGGSVGIWPTDE